MTQLDSDTTMKKNPEFIRCEWQEASLADRAKDLSVSLDHHQHGPGNMRGCDTFLCVPGCGNTTGSFGFFPCDDAGADMDPSGAWKNRYRCDCCRRIIDGGTGEVIGFAPGKAK